MVLKKLHDDSTKTKAKKIHNGTKKTTSKF